MPDVRETFCFIFIFLFFADNFTGLKDTEPYKTDVSFLCQYMYVFYLQCIHFWECFQSTVCIDGTEVNMCYTEYHKMEHVCT